MGKKIIPNGWLVRLLEYFSFFTEFKNNCYPSQAHHLRHKRNKILKCNAKLINLIRVIFFFLGKMP